MTLADIILLRNSDPAAARFLALLERTKRKRKISQRIIYTFDDFVDADKMLLKAILENFRSISKDCYLLISGSRVRGCWHENHEEFGTSDWDIVIRNISQPDRELIRRKILPKLEAEFNIKIDKNLTGFGGRYVEVK